MLVQEEGVLFLPFEQRMTRDIQQWRERRSARRGKGSGTSSVKPTISDASTSKANLLQDLHSCPSDAVVGMWRKRNCSVEVRDILAWHAQEGLSEPQLYA